MCPICGSHRIKFRHTISGYRLWRCQSCSVEFVHPQPDTQALNEVYSANYFLGEQEGISEAEVSRLKRQTAKRYVDRILAIRSNRKGKLLEIGCGTGDLLLEAQSRGFQVNGIEFSPHAVEIANRRLGEHVVQQGEIQSVNLPYEGFDVAFFADVLEHVREPASFLARVNRYLCPDGLVFLVTPSADSWSRWLMGKRWMEYKVEHLFYFNRRSLSQLLHTCGFEDVQFHRNAKILSLEYVRAHFRRFHVPFWSAAVSLTAAFLPRSIVRKEFPIVASGVIATARKSSNPG